MQSSTDSEKVVDSDTCQRAGQVRHMCTYTNTHTRETIRPQHKQEGQSRTQPVSQSRASQPLNHSNDTIQTPLD